MARPKESVADEKPTHFFVKELATENPPSFQTLQMLYRVSIEFFQLSPWNEFSDTQLVLVGIPNSEEIAYCSVMGALGEVFRLHAYLGRESYRLFRRIASGKKITPGEFFATQKSLYAEFVQNKEMEAADKKLLTALGHPPKVKFGPIFRSIRPGYNPWYVTESEAQTLIECLRGTLGVYNSMKGGQQVNYWPEPDVYPLLTAGLKEQTRINYRLQLVKVSDPPPPSLAPATLSDARLQRIKAGNYVRQGAMELDHFYDAASIGKKFERKACVRMVLAADSKTALCYPPQVLSPEASTADALVTAVLEAVESTRTLPREIRVKDLAFQTALEPLAKELGCEVRVVKALPALNQVKAALFQHFDMNF